MNIIEDKAGNEIYRKQDDIYLALKEENRTRKVGTIVGDKIIMKRDSKKHYFRKGDSYGFNHNLLIRLNKVTKVELHIDKKKHLIPIDYILEKGEFLLFKQQGFELQIFLKTDLIETF